MIKRRTLAMALALALGIMIIRTPFISSFMSAQALESRKSDSDGVQVVVTPKSLDPAATTWDFEIVLDTHTKPLNDDMARTSELIADGRSYAPLGWQGDQPGGHHRKGTLSFARPTGPQKVIEVRINGIGSSAARTFRWEFP